jgi:hypothetical protein
MSIDAVRVLGRTDMVAQGVARRRRRPAAQETLRLRKF